MALWQLKQKNAPSWAARTDSAEISQTPLPSAASPKEKINLEQAVAGWTPSKIRKMDPEPLAAKEKKLSILNTLYPLNATMSKKIIIGLFYDSAQRSFVPTAHMTNADCSYNIYMDGATWSSLQNHFDSIVRYFEVPSANNQPETIVVTDALHVMFANSCGAKAVLFVNISPKFIVKDLFKHSIIMHKKTFDGLRRAAVCADERFHRISAVATQVNSCKDNMREALAAYIDTLAINEKDCDNYIYDILVKKHGANIVTSVKSEFVKRNDTVFLKHYFDIVYVELAFHPKIFVNEIISILSFNK